MSSDLIIQLVNTQAKRLKAIMMAAAELAELRLQDIPSTNHRSPEIDNRDRVFLLLDKNGDGKISIEELIEVMEELGAQGEDAREMMQLLDANSDGSLSSDEFDLFQKQVCPIENIVKQSFNWFLIFVVDALLTHMFQNLCCHSLYVEVSLIR